MNTNHSIFMTKANLDGPVVSTFVSNIKIIALKDSGKIEWVKLELIFAFFMNDMGSISFYLGLKVQQDQTNQTIKLSQSDYINKFFNKFYVNKAHIVNTPKKKTALFKQKTKWETLLLEKKRYQGMIESLIFLMVETRLNIAFATFVASYFAKNPDHQYTKAVKTILQYLKGLNKQIITYGSQNKLLVEGYSNSD